MKNKFILFSILILIFSVSASAAQKWNMPTAYGDGYFQTQNVREFAARVEKETKGEINITVHSGASLFSASEIFRAVRGGQAEIGELIMSNLGNEDPLFNVDSIPFLAVGYGQSRKLWEISRPALEKSLDKMGVVLLFAVPWPPQNFYTKEELKDISFFKGRKLRAYNAITSRMADLLGASPTTVQVPEIPQAFSTGIVDAMITSGATGVSSQSWDFINYYVEVEAWMPKNMVFINKKTWNRLSKENQKIIMAAAKDAEEKGWKLSEEVNAKDVKTLAEKGIKVVKPAEGMMNDLRKVGKTMADEWVNQTGKTGKDILSKLNK